jgi:hypothetical protein
MIDMPGFNPSAALEKPVKGGLSWSEDRLVYAVLALVLTIFLVFGLVEVYRTDGLFSYDPNYHMNLSQLLEREQKVLMEIDFYESSNPPQYLTSMQLITVLIHKYTGLSYLAVYRTFGLFCRVFAALALFITAAYFLGSKKYALVAVILFLSAPYIFLRSLITYPENLVLPFHILIFGSIVRGLREKRLEPALPLYISAALYIHYRSLIIPVVLIFLYVVFRKSIKNALAVAVSTAVLSAPILYSAVNQYIKYFNVNVGPGARWKPFATGASYVVPTLDYYLAQLGVLLILFTLLGLFFLLRRMDSAKFILLVWLVFAFILTRGKEVGLYIPTDRMLAYLCIPAALVSALFIKEMFEAAAVSPRTRTALACIVALSLVFILAVNLPAVQGWVGIGAEQREAAAWLNENVGDDAVMTPFRVDLVTIGVNKFGNIAFLNAEEWESAFDAPQGVGERLQEMLPGVDIYVVVGIEGFQVHDAELVFKNEKVKIYRYDEESA